MREILFRGLVRRKGEKVNMAGVPLPSKWVYGGVFPQNKGGSYSIIYTYEPLDKWPVYAETVGQYIGVVDGLGQRIFEGDLITSMRSEKNPVYYQVCYSERIAGFVAVAPGQKMVPAMNYGSMKNYKVVGNIYDDPELLEGAKE